MSGFPVPAKAKEAAARGIATGRDPEARWDDHWTTASKLRFLADGENAIHAALPVLAEDPDLIERLAEYQATEANLRWDKLTDEGFRPAFRESARNLLAALFGVASPSTPKETDGD